MGQQKMEKRLVTGVPSVRAVALLWYNGDRVRLNMNIAAQKQLPVAQTLSALAEASLVMLGTIHRDREAGALLSEWLDYLKPDVITLEFSRYGMLFRKAHASALRARLDALLAKIALHPEPSRRKAVQALYDYIELPYEYTETSRYADHCGIPLHLLDVDLFSHMHLRKIDELMDEENLRTWFSDHAPPDNEVDKERALARLFFDKGIRTFEYTEEMLIRDKQVKEQLLLLARHYQGKRIVHVCGWRHCADQQNIFDSLRPVKVFVHDRSICI